MELTKKDRLLLFNQLEILKHLNPDEVDRYEVEQKIIANGYKYHYDELVEGFDDDRDVSISEYVFDVLQMYRSLNNSYVALNPEEQSQIDIKSLKFRGFDGNEEGAYYSYASFLLKDYDRYGEIYDNGKVELNSHRNMIRTYDRMLETWKSFNDRYGDLTLNQIKEIVK